MSTITTKDGTQIYYKDWGTGQPIVFSHGWPLSADDWDTQMLFFLKHGYRVIALYLNVFVLIAQLFMKVPALKAMAPTGSEPPFLVAQLVCMALFVVLGIGAAIKFRSEAVRTA